MIVRRETINEIATLKSLGGVRLDPGAAGVAACGIVGNWNGIALQVDFYA